MEVGETSGDEGCETSRTSQNLGWNLEALTGRASCLPQAPPFSSVPAETSRGENELRILLKYPPQKPPWICDGPRFWILNRETLIPHTPTHKWSFRLILISKKYLHHLHVTGHVPPSTYTHTHTCPPHLIFLGPLLVGHLIQLVQLPCIKFCEFGHKYPQVPGRRWADFFLSCLF